MIKGRVSSGRMACRASVDLHLCSWATVWPTFTSDLSGGDLLFFFPQTEKMEQQLPTAAPAAGRQLVLKAAS